MVTNYYYTYNYISICGAWIINTVPADGPSNAVDSVTGSIGLFFCLWIITRRVAPAINWLLMRVDSFDGIS